jgi:DNA-binding transcriptional LysR family regulator
MQLHDLMAFREVARQRSFSQAAARLGYVQSTISARVQNLERDLGASLFDRLARSVSLTDAGRALLPHAERILELSSSAEAAVADAVAGDGALLGSISVSAPESLLTYRLPAVLSRFRSLAPGVRIDLKPTPIGRLRGATRRALANGEVDVAFVLDTPLKIPGIISERLIREDISVIAAPRHRLASKARTGPADIDGEVVLLPEAPDSGCAYRGQFERQLTDRHVSPRDALEFASIETVKQCVVAGMGVSALPSVVVEADVAAGNLVRLAWWPAFEVYTQVAWNERRSLTPAMVAFINTAKATFASGAAGTASSAR